MKKLLKILSAAMVSTAFIGTAAGAATCSGTINLTGPESNNQITCNDTTNVSVTCNNHIVVGTVNEQTGTSGNGDVSNNTAGGNVATGTVLNNNGTNVTVGAACGGQATTPAGAGQVQGASTVAPVQPGGGEGAALPDTASVPATALVATSLATAAGAFGLSRVIVSAYRRFMK